MLESLPVKTQLYTIPGFALVIQVRKWHVKEKTSGPFH